MGPKALFDLKNDPDEMTNLIGEPEFQNIQAGLDALLQEQMIALEDDWDKEAVYPPADFDTHSEGILVAQRLREIAILED